MAKLKFAPYLFLTSSQNQNIENQKLRCSRSQLSSELILSTRDTPLRCPLLIFSPPSIPFSWSHLLLPLLPVPLPSPALPSPLTSSLTLFLLLLGLLPRFPLFPQFDLRSPAQSTAFPAIDFPRHCLQDSARFPYAQNVRVFLGSSKKTRFSSPVNHA